MEKHYSIDAGNGEKMDGCPYSLFEDGHDVKDYIIPPKGYEFVGFTLVDTPNNQIYDGKLVAQYKKLPIKERVTTVARSLIWILGIIAVIGLIIALTVSVFKKPSSPRKPNTEKTVSADSAVAVIDTTQPAIPQEKPEENVIPETEETTENQPIDEPSAQFNQALWELIHAKSFSMDAYDSLFKANKGQVSGAEYDYLRFTILKDYNAFREWHGQLKKVPQDDLDRITSIDTLVRKLKEYR